MRACGAAAAPFLVLLAQHVQGSRFSISVDANSSVSKYLTTEWITNQCPFGPAGPYLFRARDVPARQCCPNQAQFYACKDRYLQLGDLVQVSDRRYTKEDEPPTNVPLLVSDVKEKPFEEPVITVVRHRRTKTSDLPEGARKKAQWTFRQSALNLSYYTPNDFFQPVPPVFMCSCNFCSQLEGKYDFTRYEVLEEQTVLRKRGMIVKASMVAKGLNVVDTKKGAFPDTNQYVVYLYPDSRNLEFAFNPILCQRIACWQQREGVKVIVEHVKSKEKALAFLKRFPDSPRSIIAVILGAKGGKTELGKTGRGVFYSEAEWGTELFEELSKRTTLDATIMLEPFLDNAMDAGKKLDSKVVKFVAHKMHGRQVKAPTVAFDHLAHKMWSPGSAPGGCLAEDTAEIVRDTAAAMKVFTAGRPKCEDLTDDDVTMLAQSEAPRNVCVSVCGQYCSNAQKDLRQRLAGGAGSGATLTETRAQENDRESDCSMMYWRRVCIVAMQ